MKGKFFKALVKFGSIFAAGVVFAMICFVGINVAMEPTSRSEYCGSKCHEMQTAYQSWEISGHGAGNKGIRVECVDCHLPPKENFFRHLTAKAYAGAKDMYKHHFGGEYNSEQMAAKVAEHMPNSTCLRCHDNLSAKAGNSAARMAHTAVLAEPESTDIKCLECHKEAAHKRDSKLFSP
ncbi:MAG: cytochrome c3 family protein [Planctomycetota bacterium]|jgi:cytochrome c nitrite reductase small subunit